MKNWMQKPPAIKWPPCPHYNKLLPQCIFTWWTPSHHMKKGVKAHYGDLLWNVTLYYFLGMCMFWVYPTLNFRKIFTIFLHIMLEYNLYKRFFKKYFISFYIVKDWNIFMETNIRRNIFLFHPHTSWLLSDLITFELPLVILNLQVACCID
jgi:hypothetical protein